MKYFRLAWVMVILFLAPWTVLADEKADIAKALARPIIGPRQSLVDVQEYCDARVPRMPDVKTAAEWTKLADQMRRDALDKVVFRGEAARWRQGKVRIEWQETIKGGPGYRIKKLRYEALPGMWIPALLYEPEKLTGKVPVYMAVNGHSRRMGKASPSKQIRCINLAKRGILVLNPEWLGMGQLNETNFSHYRMNQLDLCGTSGLAPFYLSMQRGLDVLLSLENADPKRVAVSGLSGGGWQTIIISALDTRVTLSNPVAGYSSFLTRIRHFKDLGDSEQTPVDLATVADYSHLTAMMAPRPTLLTFNAKDNCCFESGYALPPLQKAAAPMFKLLGQPKALRSHVNIDPGNHNYGLDNRQAFYRQVGDFFFAGDKSFSAKEIACEGEVKSKEALTVKLPEKREDFHTLARNLMQSLPRHAELPTDAVKARAWQKARRADLAKLIRAKQYPVKAEKTGNETVGETKVTFWKWRMGNDWSVPAVEFTRGNPKQSAILISDNGRKSASEKVGQLLTQGYRVFAVDPFYFGEAKVMQKDFLFALLISAVGERPLGVQANQLTAGARWIQARHGGPVSLVADGPRTGLMALAAAAADEKSIKSVRLHQPLSSLKEVIEQNWSVNQKPELFCFGLLEQFDVKQLTALTAPRHVVFAGAGDGVKAELTGLKEWYQLLGEKFDPME